MSYMYERHVAVEASIKACRLSRSIRAGDLFGKTMEKEDKSPVTVADFGAQAVISRDLLKAFPDDPIMAEEELAEVRADLKEKIVHHVNTIFPDLNNEHIFTAIDRCNYNGGSTGRFWSLDPVDGTKGFLRGDQYATALALIEDGEVVLSVLGCPNLPYDMGHPEGLRGCLFISIKGQGSRMRLIEDSTEKTIRVTEITDPAMASFWESVEPTSTPWRKNIAYSHRQPV